MKQKKKGIKAKKKCGLCASGRLLREAVSVKLGNQLK
jgi:hypothetical protein